MNKIIKTGSIFYAIALIAYGVQQFIYADFRTVFVPAWQSSLPGLPVWAYIFGIGLIVAGCAIIFEKKAKEASLISGSILLLLFCLVHIPFELISDPYNNHFYMWASSLKELALAGGAFVIAGTFHEENRNAQKKSVFIILSEKIIPFGKIFFSITMISFGIQHFLYAESVAILVPAWIRHPMFWTYFAGATLIGSGLAIILNIRRREIAVLLGTMIFFWLILLHIPRAINFPVDYRGNEVSSAFDALAFCGIAFVIAFGIYVKKGARVELE